MPIPLGILAAAGVRPTAGGSYDWLETITVGSGGATSVTFSNLNTYSPTYQHLQIRVAARTDRASYVDSAMVQFNADTGNNYIRHWLVGTGSAVESSAETGQDKLFGVRITAANAGTSVFGGGVLDILDAYETKNKVTRSLSGYTTSSGSEIYMFSGLWLNTNALTSIKLLPNIGTNFVQGSRFSLYGLKAS